AAALSVGWEKQLKEQQAAYDDLVAKEVEARDAIANIQLTIADARVAGQTDKQAAATGRYSRAHDDLRDSYREGKITLSEYEGGGVARRRRRCSVDDGGCARRGTDLQTGCCHGALFPCA